MTKRLQKEEIIPNNKTFVVADLGCASALLTAGFSLLGLDRENPQKIKFVWHYEAGIEKVADDFWADRLEQKSRSFWDNARNLKNLLHSRS